MAPMVLIMLLMAWVIIRKMFPFSRERIVIDDRLSPVNRRNRLKMEAARSIREDFLHQNSFHEIDTYTPLRKQYLMMKLVLAFYEKSVDALNKGADMNALIAMPVREKIGRYKYTTDADIENEYKNVEEELDKEVAAAFGKEDF